MEYAETNYMEDPRDRQLGGRSWREEEEREMERVKRRRRVEGSGGNRRGRQEGELERKWGTDGEVERRANRMATDKSEP